MRILLETHQKILHRLLILEKNDEDQEKKIMLILDYLKSFDQMKHKEEVMKNRKRIGFNIGGESNEPGSSR